MTGYTAKTSNDYSNMGSLSNINNSAFSNHTPIEMNEFISNQGVYNNDYTSSMNYNQHLMPAINASTNLKRKPNPAITPASNNSNARRKQNSSIQMAGRNNLKTHGNYNTNTKQDNINFVNTNNSPVFRSGGNIGKVNYNNMTPARNIYANDFAYTQSSNNSKMNNPTHYKGKNVKELETVLMERDNVIIDLKDTVEILELKIKKMEQLLALKDGKVNSLLKKIDYN